MLRGTYRENKIIIIIIIIIKLGSKNNETSPNSWSDVVGNLTPRVTFSARFHESHAKGHPIAHNGEFLQLSPLRAVREQPAVWRQEAPARPRVADTARLWGGGRTRPPPWAGFRSLTRPREPPPRSPTHRTAVESHGTPRGNAIRELQDAPRATLGRHTRHLLRRLTVRGCWRQRCQASSEDARGRHSAPGRLAQRGGGGVGGNSRARHQKTCRSPSRASA